MMIWFQIYIKDNQPKETMKQVDEYISTHFPAAFAAPDGTPIITKNGNYEVRLFMSEYLEILKKLLTENYGLEIVEIVENK